MANKSRRKWSYIYSQDNIGHLYCTVFKDYDNAKYWFTKAAEADHPTSQHNLGYLYYKILHDYDNAKYWFTKAANSNHSGSQNNLGHLYHTVFHDYDLAKYWYIKSDSSDARYNLGSLYENIFHDYKTASEWYVNAAHLNLKDAIKKAGFWFTSYTKNDAEGCAEGSCVCFGRENKNFRTLPCSHALCEHCI